MVKRVKRTLTEIQFDELLRRAQNLVSLLHVEKDLLVADVDEGQLNVAVERATDDFIGGLSDFLFAASEDLEEGAFADQERLASTHVSAAKLKKLLKLDDAPVIGERG
jgi:hypothetical protein